MNQWSGFWISAPGEPCDGFALSGLWVGKGSVRCIPGPLYSGSDVTIHPSSVADVHFLDGPVTGARKLRMFTQQGTVQRIKPPEIVIEDNIDDAVVAIANQLTPLQQCRLYMYLHALGHRMSTAHIKYRDGVRQLLREAKKAASSP